MKRILLGLLVAGLSSAAAQAVAVLTITEESGAVDSLSATFNTGEPGALDEVVALSLSGPVNGWTIEIPSTYSLNSVGSVLVGEPTGPATINEVLVGTQPTFLTWTSDINNGAGGIVANVVLVPNAGVYGDEQLPFDLVLRDIEAPVQAPDPGSTLVLLGMGLAAVQGLNRFSDKRRTASRA